MRKGSDIIGKRIVVYDRGERLDKIGDLIFDQVDHRLLGFVVHEGGLFSSAKVLPWVDVQAIGPDAVIIPSANVIVSAKEVPEIQEVLRANNIIKGTRIMTTDGRDLGTMADLFFNDETGEIEGYEVTGGFFADAVSGRSFVPAPQTIKIGRDVAFVPPQTAALMEEQVGGLRGAMHSAGSRIQETSGAAGQRLQEFSESTGQRLQELSESTGQRFQEFSDSTGQKFQEISDSTGQRIQSARESAGARASELSAGAMASMTNRAVSPQEQRAYVVGKTAGSDVSANDGAVIVHEGEVVTEDMAAESERQGVLDRLYRATGGSLTVGISRAATNAFASGTVEQTEGRRSQRTVYTEEGMIVAAQGQIVTDAVIESARRYRKEAELMDATGLSRTDAAREGVTSAWSSSGDGLRENTQRIAASTKGLWDRWRDDFGEMQDRRAHESEERKIKRALGRPVTRVILDQDDSIILNVGELITNQALERSREAGVLDILLNSVYDKWPQLSTDDLRAPEPGEAALHEHSTEQQPVLEAPKPEVPRRGRREAA